MINPHRQARHARRHRGRLVTADSKSTLTLLDSHLHFWDLSRLDYPWLHQHPQLQQSFMLREFNAALAGYKVQGMVLIEAACRSHQTMDELRSLLDQADRDRRILAVIPWAPVHAPGQLERFLDAMPRDPRVRGVRRIIQSEKDDRFCLRPQFVRGVSMLATAGMHFELTVTPQQLPAVTELVTRLPQVRFLLDHAGNPDIRGEGLSSWAQQIRRLGKLPNLWCKLSGLPLRAGPDWTRAQLRPYIEVVIDSFGWRRVMFASDWPNMTRVATYGQWVRALSWATAQATKVQRQALFFGNARSFYSPEPGEGKNGRPSESR